MTNKNLEINEEKIDEKNFSEYCQCENVTGMYANTELDEFGYWYMCNTCNKKIEDGFHYYNHFDGDDNDDIDGY